MNAQTQTAEVPATIHNSYRLVNFRSQEVAELMDDYSQHKLFTCKHHPMSLYSSKHPINRSVFIIQNGCEWGGDCDLDDLLLCLPLDD